MTTKKASPKKMISAASHLKTWTADEKADLKRKVKSTKAEVKRQVISAKAAVKRQVKSAVDDVSHWSTAKKIGVATAAVAVPILAAAIATAVVVSRKRAAEEAHRNYLRTKRA